MGKAYQNHVEIINIDNISNISIHTKITRRIKMFGIQNKKIND